MTGKQSIKGNSKIVVSKQAKGQSRQRRITEPNKQSKGQTQAEQTNSKHSVMLARAKQDFAESVYESVS